MSYSNQTLRKARHQKKENRKMFNIDSAYEITEVVFGKIIPGNNTNYGIFVLRGTPKYSHEAVLILALMSTDGKSFWPIATNIMDEKDFTADPLLSTREGNVSAVLQRTNDGNLVISLFYTFYHTFLSLRKQNPPPMSLHHTPTGFQQTNQRRNTNRQKRSRPLRSGRRHDRRHKSRTKRGRDRRIHRRSHKLLNLQCSHKDRHHNSDIE